MEADTSSPLSGWWWARSSAFEAMAGPETLDVLTVPAEGGHLHAWRPVRTSS
jgi:hypothetical protein